MNDTDKGVVDLSRLRVVAFQVSKHSGPTTSHSIVQSWGFFDSDEEAVGAVMKKMPTIKPDFSVDQFLVCQPFAPTSEESSHE